MRTKVVNWRNVLKVVFVILGTIIGAGFASGKEIFMFFNMYGYKGLLGVIVSMMCIGGIIYKTFSIVIDNNIGVYNEFMNKILGGKKRLNYIVNNIINIFLFMSFQIMVAGFGAYFFQEFNISRLYGTILIIILSYITFMNNIEGVVKINEYLIPVIAVLIVMLGFKNSSDLLNIELKDSPSMIGWIKSSILYASYNSISLIPIIISLKKYITTKKEVKVVSLLTIALITSFGFIIYFLLNSNFEIVKNIEMPVVYIASLIGENYKYIYGFVVLVAIFTTAISAGYSLLVNCTRDKKTYNKFAILICLSSVIISQIGFSNLLNLMYPIFGYLGLVQIFFLLIT